MGGLALARPSKNPSDAAEPTTAPQLQGKLVSKFLGRDKGSSSPPPAEADESPGQVNILLLRVELNKMSRNVVSNPYFE